ncbi:hypothetical protein Tco_1102226 [Tanacetum coccineum]
MKALRFVICYEDDSCPQAANYICSIMCGASARMHVYNKHQFLIEDEAAASHHLWFMMIIGFLVSSSNLVTTTKRKDLVIPILCQTKVSVARVKMSFVLMLLASKVFNAAYSSLVLGWDKDSIKLKKAVFEFIEDVIMKTIDYHLFDVVVEFHSLGALDLGSQVEFHRWSITLEYMTMKMEGNSEGNSKRQRSTGKEDCFEAMFPRTYEKISWKRMMQKRSGSHLELVWCNANSKKCRRLFSITFFEQELSSASKTSSSAQNVAFVSQLSKSSTNKVFADEVIYSLFAKQSEDWDLLHEDLEQIDDVDIEEMDINWQIAMIAIRMECTAKGTHDGKKKRDSFYQHQEVGKQEKNQMGLLTMDDGIVNWGEHTAVEETNHALMAISSSNEANEIYEKDEKLKRYRRIGMKAVKEKEQLQKTLDTWKDSSKNLWRLINYDMSSNSKVGLGFEIQSNNEVLSYEEEMNFSVFKFSKEDSVGKPLYSRFAKTNDFKGVPHPLSGDYTPSPQEEIDESQEEIDDSLYVYGKKGPQKPEISVSDENSSEHSTCQSNDSEGSCAREAEVKRVLVPRSVQLNTGRTNINSVRPKVNAVSPKINAVSPKVNTVRPRQPIPHKTSNSLSPKRPQMNQINQRRDFSKSYSSVRRPFAKSTAQMAHSNAVMGSWGSAVKTSASYNWRNSRPNFNYNSGPTFIRTVNANGPQGRPKPAKAWLTRINWRILKKFKGDLLPLDVAKAHIWYLHKPPANAIASEIKMSKLGSSHARRTVTVQATTFMVLVDLPHGMKVIGTKWVYRNKRDERGVVYCGIKQDWWPKGTHRKKVLTMMRLFFVDVARIEANQIEVFMPHNLPPGFVDPDIPQRFYKVVTPKTSHLNAVKPFSDSDYGGSNLDRKSTTGGCQFLGQRLISWQCKKQTIVATSTTEAEYVAAANCCGQVLWVQNQLLDYGFNFMNTKIHIDNESTICIVKNPVYHSKTKHIEIRHHFIRDCYEKKLISVEKIHTDLNVADLHSMDEREEFQKHDAVAPSQPTSSSPLVPIPPNISSSHYNTYTYPASIPSPIPIPATQPEPFAHTFEEPSPVYQPFSPPHEQAQGQMAMDDLLHVVPKLISRIDSLETDLKQTKLTMGNAIVKLVKKVKKLEGLLKKRHMVVSDSEEEEPEAQGRKSQDDPLDSSVQGLVTPSTTQSICFREEQVEDIRDTREEKEAKGKKVVSSLDFQEEVDIGAEQTKTPKRLKDDEAKDAEPTRSQEKRKNIMQGNGLQKTLDEEESEDSDEVG